MVWLLLLSVVSVSAVVSSHAVSHSLNCHYTCASIIQHLNNTVTEQDALHQLFKSPARCSGTGIDMLSFRLQAFTTESSESHCHCNVNQGDVLVLDLFPNAPLV